MLTVPEQTATTAAGPLGTHAGWHLLAFTSELTGDITPLSLGDRRLVAVADGDSVRVFDANCPHRGAHLGYGGRLDRGCIICPFHGRRVHLGDDGPGDYHVAEYHALVAGEAVFVCTDRTLDHGFSGVIAELSLTHRLVAGLTIPVAVTGDIIVENAFDPYHFAPVHGMMRHPLMVPYAGPDGALTVETKLLAPRSTYWDEPTPGPAHIRFHARAFSPTLVLTQLGDGSAPYVLTATVPTETGCVARLAIGVALDADGNPPPPEFLAGLIAGSRRAFNQDIPVWEHLDPHHVPRYDARDASVLAFREFVGGFAS